MNLKGTQTDQLLAALGACLAAMILASPAAGRPDDGAGNSNRPAPEVQSLTSGPAIVNSRQLELASDQQLRPTLLSDAGTGPVSLRDRPDGYQPQLGASELAVVADDGFDWTTTGFAASIIAAMLVVAAGTFTYGNRRGYASA